MISIILLLLGILEGEATVRVHQMPSSLILKYGEWATLTCTLQDNQTQLQANFIWTLEKAEKELLLETDPRIKVMSSTDHLSSTLIISTVTPRDIGLYVCSASAMNGQDLIKHSGNGTHLSVTAYPEVTVRMGLMEQGSQLLTCKAKAFYPPMLNISWHSFLTNLLAEEVLSENKDGTYTKTSAVEITENITEQMGKGTTCKIEHITMTVPVTISFSAAGNGSEIHTCVTGVQVSLYVQVLSVRVLLVFIPIICLLTFKVYLHLTFG